jgi:hypothetical protein
MGHILEEAIIIIMIPIIEDNLWPIQKYALAALAN